MAGCERCPAVAAGEAREGVGLVVGGTESRPPKLNNGVVGVGVGAGEEAGGGHTEQGKRGIKLKVLPRGQFWFGRLTCSRNAAASFHSTNRKLSDQTNVGKE